MATSKGLRTFQVMEQKTGNLMISKELFNFVNDILKTVDDARPFMQIIEIKEGKLNVTDGRRALQVDLSDQEVSDGYFQPAKISKDFFLVRMEYDSTFPNVNRVIPEEVETYTVVLEYTLYKRPEVEFVATKIMDAPVNGEFLKPLKGIPQNFTIGRRPTGGGPAVFNIGNNEALYIVMPMNFKYDEVFIKELN